MCNQLKGPLNHKEFKLYRKSLIDFISLGKIYFNVQGTVNLDFKQHHWPPGDFHNEDKQEKDDE